MNKFKAKLYAEFEDNCFKVLGVSSNRVREVLNEHNDDIDAKFEAAWKFSGASFMRQTMSMTLATLEMVYHEASIGRELTLEEQDERINSLGIGLNSEIKSDWLKRENYSLLSQKLKHKTLLNISDLSRPTQASLGQVKLISFIL